MTRIAPIVTPTTRSSVTVSRHCFLFFLLARIYIHRRDIRKQTGAILLSGNLISGTDRMARYAAVSHETPGCPVLPRARPEPAECAGNGPPSASLNRARFSNRRDFTSY